MNTLACWFAVAALLWVNAGDVHAHICLDGNERPVSYHADNITAHDDHADEEADHNDVDNKIVLSTLPVKSPLPDLDIPCVIPTDPLRIELVAEAYSIRRKTFPTSVSTDVSLPPLRAPPV